MTDIFDNDIKELMKLVTTDFDDFYKKTEKENKSSGYNSTAASSGNYSKAASSGNSSKAASSGNSSTAASSGSSSKAASSGYNSTAASSGYNSKAASSGSSSKAASSGYNSACSALGYRAAVKGSAGNLLMASEYITENGEYIPIGGKADIVDGKILKPDCWYIVESGEWVEVDFTDDMFHRIVSTRNNIKKLKNENGEIVYLVSDGDKHAHGKTIKEARENLIYKIGDRDKSAYEHIKLSSKHTVPELIEMYRVITGACEYGVKDFVKSQENLKKKYSLSEIIELTENCYGHDVFKDFF